MTRSRKSAREAGSKHNHSVAKYLAENGHPYALKAPAWGANDKGDVTNVFTAGGERIAVEAKDYGGRYEVGPWLREAEAERVNYHAIAGIVVAKRRGTTDPGDQVVITTLRDLVAILTETRPDETNKTEQQGP